MTVLRGVLVLTLLAGAACGGSSANRPAGPAKEAPVDVGDASKAARGVLTEIYGDLRRGDVGGVQSLLAPEVFVVGPGAKDVFVARADAVVALGGVLRSGDRHKLVSRGLSVHAVAGGHSAWASDTLEVEGVPLALTAVLVESDGLWTVVAVLVSRTSGGAPDPAGARAPLPGGVAPAAADAVKLYRAGAAAPEQFATQLAPGPDTTIVGAGPKEITRGAKAIKKLWKKHTPAKLVLDGEPRAAATPDGALAWVFANVDVPVPGGGRMPYRTLALYQREGKTWQLVAMQDSTAAGK